MQQGNSWQGPTRDQGRYLSSQYDAQYGQQRRSARGPKGYKRSDERIIEELWAKPGTPDMWSRYNNVGVYTTYESVTAYHRGRPKPIGRAASIRESASATSAGPRGGVALSSAASRASSRASSSP